MKETKGMGVGEQFAIIGKMMAEDILAASDEEILSEAREDGIDPTTKASELRVMALAKIKQAKRERLALDRQGYEKAKQAPQQSKARPPLEEIKRLVQGLIQSGASTGLSLAFRKGQSLSDSDWEGLWDDMVEKGLIDDGKQGD